MKIETYRKNYWKGAFIFLLVGVVIGVVLITKGTQAKYQTSMSVPLIRGTINYTPYDFKIMAMYQENDSGEYEEVEVMPSSGYVINEEDSYCYTVTQEERDDTVILRTDSEGNHEFGNLKKNSKCYLWFDKEVSKITVSELIASKTIATRSSYNVALTEDTTGTMYSAADDDGTSYYFAGAATDNYVYFAGYYWRIIRINGDKTIRLIYEGTTLRENGTSSSDTQIGESAFNSTYNDNAYVGFMYTVGILRGLGTSSTIKDSLDTWYTNNLSSYAEYIDTNAGFCGDRTPSTSGTSINNSGGTSTTVTYYAGYIRLWYQLYNQSSTTASPTFKCANSSDLYTVSGANKGNKALSNPIGLISAEEVSYAGGLYLTNNTSYYLYTGIGYWTMSPYAFYGSSAYVFYVYSNGGLGQDYVYSTYGVRPVINLRADVKLSGSGTSSDAYTVS